MVKLLFITAILNISTYAAGPLWTQTTWDGGSGQNTWSDATKYQSDDGHAEGAFPVGDLLLKRAYNTGTGASGALTVSALNTVVNTYTYITAATTTAGATSIVVKSGTGFSNGDEILIIQAQDSISARGPSNAGVYEFRKITSGGGTTTLTLDSALVNTFYSGTYNQQYSSVTQVVRVPNYTSVTVQNGASIIPLNWNDTVGGIVVFRVQDSLNVLNGGKIEADGRGFNGGMQGGTDGYKGESWVGGTLTSPIGGYSTAYPATNAILPNGSGGGCYVNGAGGSYGSLGTSGDGYNQGGICIGQPGTLCGSADLTRIYLGSGGGGGHPNSGQPHGGKGGGAIYCISRVLLVQSTGAISVNGTAGYFNPTKGQWGAGGGSGGSIYLVASDMNIGTGLVTASGGLGVQGLNGGGHGGNGGSGRIRLDYSSLSGSSTPAAGYNGAAQYFDSTNVVSSIYDMGTSVTGPYKLTFSASYNSGNVHIRMRTSSSASMTGATAWSSCDTLSTGQTLMGKAGISPNQRYLQYRVGLIRSGLNSPSVSYLTTELNESPSAVTLASPANGTEIPDLLPLFDWSDAADNNTASGDNFSYTLVVSTHNDFSSPVFVKTGLSASQYQVVPADNLQDNTLYYWRVYAKDSYPDSTFCVQSFHFFTDLLNESPTLSLPILPANNTERSGNDTLYWTRNDADPGDTLVYNIHLSLNSAFSPIAASKTNFIGTQIALKDLDGFASLQDDNIYHWHIEALDPHGLSSGFTSGIDSIFVNLTNDAPTVPYSLLPADGNSLRPNQYLRWKAKDGDSLGLTPDVLHYTLVVDDNADFSSPIGTTLNISVDSIPLTALTNYASMLDNTRYYWKGVAIDNHALSGSYSSGTNNFFFNKTNTAPNAVSLFSPANGASVGQTPLLDWIDGTDPDPGDSLTYTLQVDDNNDFSSPEFVNSGITSSQYQMQSGDGLTGHKTYYWRVYAKDSYPDSTVSAQTWTFVTQNSTPAAFSLTAPAAESMNGQTPLLTWNSSSDPDPADVGNLTYTVEISRDSTFPSLVLRHAGLTPTQYQVLVGDTLKGHERYFWRVYVVDTYPESTLCSNPMAFRTANHAPAVFALTLPAGGSTVNQTPLLSWVAATDADRVDSALTYSLEIDDQSDFSSPLVSKSNVTTSSYQVLSADNLEGHRTYYWRVWAKDSYPDSTLCTGSLSFNTRNHAPNAVTALTPARGSEMNALTPLFTWSAATDSDAVDVSFTYQLEVSDVSNFSHIVFTQGALASAQYQTLAGDGLLDNTAYWWRVKAIDSYPDTAAASVPFHFFTDLANQAPTVPTPLSPLPNSEVGPNDTLRWTRNDVDPGDTLAYNIHLSPDPSFAVHTASKSNFIGNKIALKDLDGFAALSDDKVYYWHIEAHDPHGVSSGYTAGNDSIAVNLANDAPSIPSGLMPLMGTAVRPTQYLGWRATDGDSLGLTPDTLHYTLIVDDNADFSSPIGTTSNLTVDSILLTSLSNYGSMLDNTRYYWKVVAIDNHGLSGSYSDGSAYFWFNKDNTAPNAVSLSSPANGASVGQTPLLDWSDGTDPDAGDSLTYTLQVDDNADFSSLELIKQGLSASQYRVQGSDGLIGHHTYYWRVYAKDSYPDSTVSAQSWSFTTQNTAPAAFSLTAPAAESMNGQTPLLTWNSSSDPDPADVGNLTYTVEISRDSAFGSLVLRHAGLTPTQYQVLVGDTLKGHERYFWRVYVVDTYPESTLCSNPMAFRTANHAPAAFVLTLPAGGSTVTQTPLLSWVAATDADRVDSVLSYSLEIDDQSDFSSPLVSKSGLTSASYQVLAGDNLEGHRTYYWRVRAKDSYPDSTPCTSSLSFNTRNHAPNVVTALTPARGSEGSALTPLFTWSAATDSDAVDVSFTYQLEVSDVSNFSHIVFTQGALASAQYQTLAGDGLLDNTAYWWRVKAIDSYPDTAAASATFHFFTDLANQPPSLPLPLSPVALTEQGVNDSLTWTRRDSDPGDTLRYDIRLSPNPSFSHVTAYRTAWPGTSIALSQLLNSDSLRDNCFYYWQVEAIDPHGLSSGYTAGTDIIAFNRVNDTPSVPFALSPASNSTRSPTQVLRWNAFDNDSLGLTPDTLHYILVIDNNADFSSPQGTTINITADSIRLDQVVNFSSLMDNVQYYWRVSAIDNHGAASAFSSSGESFWFNSVNNPPPTPTGLKPVAGSTLFPVDSLLWTLLPDPDPFDTTTYVVVVSANSDFSAIVSTDTTRLGGLRLNRLNGYPFFKDGTSYFWRIYGYDQGHALSGIAGGGNQRFIFRSTAPLLPAATYPADNTILFPSEAIGWNAAMDADAGPNDTLYYVSQVSSQVDFSILLSADTSVDTFRIMEYLSGYPLLTNNGNFHWRVQVLDNHGKASGWSTPGIFILNKVNQAPPSPGVLAPADSEVISGSSLLRWHRAEDPDPGNTVTYKLVISTDSLLRDSVVRVINLTDTAYLLDTLAARNLTGRTLADDRFYYWGVAAVDNHHASSVYSPALRFFVNWVNDTPGVPYALRPTFGTLVFPGEYLRWNCDSTDEFRDTTRYLVQVARDSLFTDLLVSGDTVVTDQQVRISSLPHYASLQSERYLYWRVAAGDGAGQSRGFSASAKIFFSLTNSAPGIPLNLVPADSSVIVYPTGNLTWSAVTDPETDPVYYEVWIKDSPIDTAADSVSMTATLGDLTLPGFVLKDVTHYRQLQDHRVYFWRVRSRDNHYNNSSWSVQKSFRFVSTPPELVIGLFPLDSIRLRPQDTLSWNPSSDADAGAFDTLRYEITIDDQAGFTSPTLKDTLILRTSIPLRDLKGIDRLKNDVYYYWRIRSLDVHGAAADYSAASLFFFNLTNTRPNPPDSLLPDSSSLLFRRPFQTLGWRGSDPDVGDTLSYRIEICRDTSFSALALVKNGWRGTSIRIDSFSQYPEHLVSDSLYYWRVRAQDQLTALSDFSRPGRFRYDSLDNRATAPVPVSPFVGGYAIPATPLLWLNSSDAEDTVLHYEVQISSDSAFTFLSAVSVPVPAAAGTTSTALLSALSGADSLRLSGLYFWRVLPFSLVDTGWVAGDTSNVMRFWLGSAGVAGHPLLTSLTVITPVALSDTARIALSPDRDVRIVFSDSTVLRPVCVSITRIPVQGAVAPYVEVADSTLRVLQGKTITANRFAEGDPHMIPLGEGAFSIRSFYLNQPDSLAQLLKPIRLQMAFHDTNQDGYVDRLFRGVRIPDSTLSLFRLNENSLHWEPVVSLLDMATDTGSALLQKGLRRLASGRPSASVSGFTDHFSVYTVMAYHSVGAPFENFKVFPSPFLLSSTGTPATLQYYLGQDADIEVRIYSRTGGRIWSKSIRRGDPGGIGGNVPNEIKWDGRNEAGRLVGNGMVVVKIQVKPVAGGEIQAMQYLGVVK
ncbi:MAG: hypothetical protein V1913_00155 [Fibrobacterota bacterium]